MPRTEICSFASIYSFIPGGSGALVFPLFETAASYPRVAARRDTGKSETREKSRFRAHLAGKLAFSGLVTQPLAALTASDTLCGPMRSGAECGTRRVLPRGRFRCCTKE